MTNMEAISYLLSIQEDEEKMQGKIRPISIHSKCKQCKRPFEEVPKLGFICKTHGTVPRKFFIDLWYKGKRFRMFCDKYGNILDSYSAARSLLGQINRDIDNHSFDPSQYVRKEKENYYLEARWKAFVKKHTNRKYLYQLNFAKKYIFGYFQASHDIRDIRQSDISLFAEAIPNMASKGLGGKSIKNVLGVLLSLVNYNYSIGVVSFRLTMPRVDVVRAPRNIPEVSESLKIIEKIEEPSRLIYLFLLTHLCRPADARALQARHFDFFHNTVRIEQGFSGNQLTETKTKKPYVIPIHPALRDKMQALCISKMPGDFVFVHSGRRWGEAKLREVWNEAARAAGFKITLYNGVKHASVSHVASESGDIYNTSKLTGHAHVSTTELYSEKVRIEKLRKIQETIIIPGRLL